jgi:hypothetical protein
MGPNGIELAGVLNRVQGLCPVFVAGTFFGGKPGYEFEAPFKTSKSESIFFKALADGQKKWRKFQKVACHLKTTFFKSSPVITFYTWVVLEAEVFAVK